VGSTVDLPDLNVWLALACPDHSYHHQALHYWEQQAAEQVLFCTVTALGLVRLVSQPKLLGLLLVVMLASGGAELVSLGAVLRFLAAVLPFLAVPSDPQRICQQPLLQCLAKAAGVTASGQLLLPATVIFGVVAVLAAAVRQLKLWLNGSVAAAIGSDLSCEAYKRTLHQPYAVHVQRNSGSVMTGITSQIGLTVNVLNASLLLFTSTLVAAGLLLALFVVDWGVALTAAVVFGVAYGLLVITSKKSLLLIVLWWQKPVASR
jgi:ATP-binding cassette, subfamily B, bacterial PglK